MLKTVRLSHLILSAISLPLAIGYAQSFEPSNSMAAKEMTADGVAPSISTLAVEAMPVSLTAKNTATFRKPTIWKLSLVTLAAANSMDVASSWGKRELNPAMAAPGQKFGTENALLKAALVGAITGVELLATRGHLSPGLYRKLAILNFINAGVVGGLAVRNFTVPATSH